MKVTTSAWVRGRKETAMLVCDRCGGRYMSVKIAQVSRLGERPGVSPPERTYELCEECAGKMDTWVETSQAEEEERAAEELPCDEGPSLE